MLYHATRQRFIGSIKREGLHAKTKKSFDGQIGEGLVYFAFDDDVAASYVECADNIPESWEDDNIVVLAVRENSLNSNKFYRDPNIKGEDNSTIAYKGSIPASKLGIIDFKDRKIIPLISVQRLSKRFYY